MDQNSPTERFVKAATMLSKLHQPVQWHASAVPSAAIIVKFSGVASCATNLKISLTSIDPGMNGEASCSR